MKSKNVEPNSEGQVYRRPKHRQKAGVGTGEVREGFTVLIAERNPHIREYLRRELTGEGYTIVTAKDGLQVLPMIYADQKPDLMILDLEIPFVDGLTILKLLKDQESPVPVIVHTFLKDYISLPEVKSADALYEKRGNNIDELKATVSSVLRSRYPERFKDIE